MPCEQGSIVLMETRKVPLGIDRCPSCGGALEVRALGCAACGLELRGTFAPPVGGPLGHLSLEQVAFLRLFVTSRGNLSDIERSLGVSYPTVRAKLDDLIAALSGEPAGGDRPPPAPAPTTRRDVLAQISDGRLTPQEGLALLRRLSERGGR